MQRLFGLLLQQKVRYIGGMSISEIESAIAKLPPSEIAKLGEWFYEFQSQVWDRRIEQDVQSGRLNALIEQAEREFESGQCQPL